MMNIFCVVYNRPYRTIAYECQSNCHKQNKKMESKEPTISFCSGILETINCHIHACMHVYVCFFLLFNFVLLPFYSLCYLLVLLAVMLRFGALNDLYLNAYSSYSSKWKLCAITKQKRAPNRNQSRNKK